jgi:hypothetical protein
MIGRTVITRTNPTNLSKIQMVFPPPGGDRRADTTEQEETHCLREFSRAIPFER